MSLDTQFPKPYANCSEVSSEHLGGDVTPAFRVFQNQPDVLHLQIRARGAITESGKGTPRNMIATVGLDIPELVTLMRLIDQFLGEASPLKILQDELEGPLPVLEVAAVCCGTNKLPRTEDAIMEVVRCHRAALARVMG